MTLRGPIAVTGTSQLPRLRLEPGGVFARGGLAVALGAATGALGALIPLLDFGKDQDGNCAAPLSRARADAGMKAKARTTATNKTSDAAK